jgi:hypothetical protein
MEKIETVIPDHSHERSRNLAQQGSYTRALYARLIDSFSILKEQQTTQLNAGKCFSIQPYQKILCRNKTTIMKTILYTILILVTSSCNMVSKETTSNLPGAYRLLSKNIKGATIDSVAGGINQLKIYTEDYFMYAAINTHDTVASFAIGSYKNEGKKITENVLFSANGINSLEAVDIILDINKNKEGYEQTITDTSSEKLSYVEKYKYVGAKTKSIIDGAWKQLETYAVKDRDTLWDKGTNYVSVMMVVIWGDFHMNPANENITHIRIWYN